MSQHIAYLTSIYPRASDTFIRTEIAYLRREGMAVDTFAIRRAEASAIVSEAIKCEQDNTTYLLEQGRLRFVAAAFFFLVSKPKRFFRTVRLLWKTSMPGLVGRAKSMAYFLEACLLGKLLLDRQISHLHNHIGENSATVAMLASSLSGIPFSLTIHGPGIFYHPRQWALGEKIQRSAFTACITHFCKSQCMVFTPHDCWNKLMVVRCCVDSHFLESEPSPIPPHKRVLFVGRLCEEKGLPLLVEVAKRLARTHDLELVIIGDGPLRKPIESLIAEHRLQANIKLLGFQSSQRIARELKDCRALVLPSFAEGLPVVIMEALAMGRPVVTTRVAGIPELVDEGCGWTVSAGDTDSLCKAVESCLDAPVNELEQLGQEGRNRVARLHNSAVALDDLRDALLASASRRTE